uniref:Mbeg1-like protein n=1 Tax=Agathobacter sp. TaxID=2021311 RepID=UPI0040568ADC
MEYEDGFFTYLKWRGDLPIKDFPFNEVDALILSELVYVEFENVVPYQEEDGCITIAEAAKRYRKKRGKTALYYADKECLLDVLAKSPRFSEMTLCNYVTTTDLVEQEQFAAMHVNVSPILTFVAFRGTDSTIVGWKEDFNMSYMMPVPAQQSAVEYLNSTCKGLFRKYWLGGHSKGGNLAIYSGVYCNPKLQKKIVTINSFDGPGFNRKVVDDPQYIAVKDRISAFVPVSSVIGMLMEHEEEYKVVQSCESPLRQHEGFSWQVDRDTFVLASEVDEFSRRMSKILKSWLKNVDDKEKKIFVDAFFGIFENVGIVELSEVFSIDVRTAAGMVKSLATLPPEVREVIGKLVKMLIAEGKAK